MTMLFIPGKFNPNTWVKALHQVDPSLQIEVWPQVKKPEAIDFAAVWHYPRGELLKYPNLKCISSLGAGIDHILNDTQRPLQVPIVRVVDNLLIRDMTQYVILAVLNYIRYFEQYQAAQSRHLWTPRSPMQETNVGIMGLGQLGEDVAIKLRDLGLNVAGWTRTPKVIENVANFSGPEQLKDFLARTDILICLLPLTTETRNILNAKTFYQLRKGAYIINVARGDHIVDADLIAALDDNQLSGACLDVFII